MNYFSYINENLERIKNDVRLGIIPCSVMNHWHIYSRFDYYLRTGKRRCESIFFTAEDFSMSERNVYYAIKQMETEI